MLNLKLFLIVTLGASGSMKQATEQMKLVPQLARKRGNAPELFVIRKVILSLKIELF